MHKKNDPFAHITLIASNKNFSYIKTFPYVDSVIQLNNNFLSKIITFFKLFKYKYQNIIIHDNKNRSKFINKMKILGHKDFQIVEPDENGNLIKAKNRDVYFPVVYSYSYRGKNTTTGLDLAWSKERMESKFLARDKGEPMASNSFEVLLTADDLKQDYGFAVSLTTYHTQNIPDHIVDRWKELKVF